MGLWSTASDLIAMGSVRSNGLQIIRESHQERTDPVKTHLIETRNELSHDVRRKSIDLLNQTLADAIDLRLQVKQAHWNVKGPHFIALHELFDDVDNEIAELVDEIAERAVQLGGVALGTAGVVAKQSRLPGYPLEIIGGREHIQAMAQALATLGTSARGAIDAATGLSDAVTADLLTQVSRAIGKLLWKVEAHVQAPD